MLAATRRLPAPPAEEMAETMADFHDLFAAIVAHDGDRAEEIASRHSGFIGGHAATHRVTRDEVETDKGPR